MKVLLTGGTGFIGAYVLKALSHKKYDVLTLTRRKDIKNSFRGDIFNSKDVEKCLTSFNPDILIHMAWDVTHGQYWHNPNNQAYKDASISLFKQFIESGGQQIIGLGTCAEYEESDTPVKEDDFVLKEKLTAYGKAKRECFEWLEQKSNNFAWLRIFGVYGEGEAEQRFFPSALKAIQDGEDFHIKTPDIFYDFVPVKHLADLIVSCIGKRNIGAVNVGFGKARSMEEWYQILKGNTSIKFDIKPSPHSRIPECGKINNLLNGDLYE